MEISNGHYQAMASHPLGEIIANCPKPDPHQSHHPQQQQQQNLPAEKKPRPHPEHALKCPRCDSTNTKFCYYNNYSLTQPRYFCKGCRRYWTQGGSLRNVPVGGGCRKNKRSSSSSKKVISSSAMTTTAAISDQSQALSISTALGASSLPPFPYDHSDLTLAFARLHNNPIGATHVPAAHPGLLEFLRNGYIDHNNQNPATGFHNLYYGNFGGGVEEVAQEMVLSTDHNGGLDTATTATGSSTPTTSASQGSCKLMDGNESSKVMMGLQWQLGSDGNIATTNMDSARDLWSNGGGGSWHGGLINSSLM